MSADREPERDNSKYGSGKEFDWLLNLKGLLICCFLQGLFILYRILDPDVSFWPLARGSVWFVSIFPVPLIVLGLALELIIKKLSRGRGING
jgi:hypothetical protein